MQLDACRPRRTCLPALQQEAAALAAAFLDKRTPRPTGQ